MTDIRTLASHIVAATTALALSLVMINGTVSSPAAAAPAATVQEVLA